MLETQFADSNEEITGSLLSKENRFKSVVDQQKKHIEVFDNMKGAGLVVEKNIR